MTRYAKGKNAVFICDRSGKKYPLRKMVREPGTGLLVHRAESDGQYSVVNHPLNFPPSKRSESIALRWALPGRDEKNFNEVLIGDEDGNVILFEGQQGGELPIFANVSAGVAGT